MITFDEFKKLDLRVAKIIQAEKVEGSEKLIKMQVGIGGESRQIVAGIAVNYKPEDLVGRQIIVVANLEPKKLAGLESQGMLLAADGEEGPIILMPEKPVLPGTIVR